MTALTSLGGRALSAVLRLPKPATDYTVHRGVRVPMRDGVELLADHYQPATRTPAGTLLLRGPYRRGWPFGGFFGAFYAGYGYHVVVQSVRGTFGSGGQFDPMVNEIADGADTAAWLCRQPWFTGSFGTVGLSYLGFTQWAMLTDPPPELAAAVITVGPHDLSAPRWGAGSFGLNDFLGWSDMVAHQEDPVPRLLLRQLRSRRRLARATAGLPLGEAGRKLLRDRASWYESWLEHPDPTDPHWTRLKLDDALDRAGIPVLLLTGWQDLFLEQTITQFQHLRGRGVTTALTVGPWTHTQVMTKGASTTLRESLQWLDIHLGGRRGPDRSPVRVFVNGHGWLELADWPPDMPEYVRHLQPGGRMGAAVPPDTARAASFTYDPANPTPTVGGRLLSAESGYRRDDRLASRPDVLCFTGDVLSGDLYVVGNPVVELAHTCDNPHNDLFVRLSEVDAKGRSRNVSDGYRCGTGTSGTERIVLDAVAHRFTAGSALRVLVAGGSHPRFARNLGTGEPMATGRGLSPATHTVHFGEGASRLILPAAAELPSAD